MKGEMIRVLMFLVGTVMLLGSLIYPAYILFLESGFGLAHSVGIGCLLVSIAMAWEIAS